MDSIRKPKMIAVLGPTATGKSDLAVDIALACEKKHGIMCEIISADSRQIYAGLDIGSGKITKREMKGIPHHGLDILSPGSRQLFTASKFQDYAIAKAFEIIKRGRLPILCGGTGFYIQGVVDGIIFPDVPRNIELRAKLKTYSKKRLQKMLQKLDPGRYAEIDQNNPYRLIRAIEISKALGKVPKIQADPKFDTLLIGLDAEDEALREKIQARIQVRLKKGMVREAEKLHEQGVSWKRMREFGLEYGLLADLLQNKLDKKSFIERLSFDIWDYVRRQRAWFRRDARIKWFRPGENKSAIKAVVEFLK